MQAAVEPCEPWLDISRGMNREWGDKDGSTVGNISDEVPQRGQMREWLRLMTRNAYERKPGRSLSSGAIPVSRARLIDDHRYEDWCASWTKDALYWVPFNTDNVEPRTGI